MRGGEVLKVIVCGKRGGGDLGEVVGIVGRVGVRFWNVVGG